MPYKDPAMQRKAVAAGVERYRELRGTKWEQINTITPPWITNAHIATKIDIQVRKIMANWEERQSYDYKNSSQRRDYDRCSNTIKEARKRIKRWLKVLDEQRHVTPESLGLHMDDVNYWLNRRK